MIVAGVDIGARQPPAGFEPNRAASVGVSMAGVVARTDFGLTQERVTIRRERLTKAKLDELINALENTVKPGGVVTISGLESGDQLGSQTGGVFYYTQGGIVSNYVNGVVWDTTITLLYVKSL